MSIWVLVYTQVLHNVGVPYCTQNTALLLESFHDCHCSRVIRLEKGGVENFPSAEEVITHSLVHSSIGTSAQGFSFDELDCLVSKLSLDFLCHCKMKTRVTSEMQGIVGQSCMSEHTHRTVKWSIHPWKVLYYG